MKDEMMLMSFLKAWYKEDPEEVICVSVFFIIWIGFVIAAILELI